MSPAVSPGPLGWLGIARLGLVQACLGAVVMISTTTLNRVMVVELALPAVVPGALIAAHHVLQTFRPGWGYRSDGAGRRTPSIMVGMVILALGGFGAAFSTAEMEVAWLPGLAAAVLSYIAIGLGAGVAGTSLLALAATRVAPERRAAAASVIWITMILGFALTAGVAGVWLEPFSMTRLLWVAASVSVAAVLVGAAALVGVEGRTRSAPRPAQVPFGDALLQVWREAEARRFACFVFTSMLAYGAQDLVIDPFAGLILGLSPGATTRLSGLQHGGALCGMVLVAALGAFLGRRRPGLLRDCTVAGCLLSAAMLGCLPVAGAFRPSASGLGVSVALLGFGNGVFAVAAVGAMMGLAASGPQPREGLRMGILGAAQAVAFALGSVLGPAIVEIVTALAGTPAPAYATVFALGSVLFVLSARLAVRAAPSGQPLGEPALLGVSA